MKRLVPNEPLQLRFISCLEAIQGPLSRAEGASASDDENEEDDDDGTEGSSSSDDESDASRFDGYDAGNGDGEGRRLAQLLRQQKAKAAAEEKTAAANKKKAGHRPRRDDSFKANLSRYAKCKSATHESTRMVALREADKTMCCEVTAVQPHKQKKGGHIFRAQNARGLFRAVDLVPASFSIPSTVFAYERKDLNPTFVGVTASIRAIQ
jgi:hypothetical protein